MAHALWITAWALGHTCLIVLCVNIAHGMGWRGRWVESATMVALPFLLVASVALAWWAIAHEPSTWDWSIQSYAGACAALGLIGFPLSTLALALRRRPSGVEVWSRPAALKQKGRSNNHDAETPVTPLALDSSIGTGPHAWLLRLPGNQSLCPQLEESYVTSTTLPESLDGLRIVHLSDLHMAPCYRRRFFEAVADRAAECDPDLVVLTGDIVEHCQAIAWIEPVLSRVKGRLGQFAILGNHDQRYGESAIRSALADSGFVDVDGRWLPVFDPDRGASLFLGGTSAPWGPALDRPPRPHADFCVVLSHTPDVFPRLAKWPEVDLVLSGHTHGGQVRLPLIGPVLLPSRYSRRFDQGFFRQGRALLYVSRGLGAKHPLRWNCPPEIAVLTLSISPLSRERDLQSVHHAGERRGLSVRPPKSTHGRRRDYGR